MFTFLRKATPYAFAGGLFTYTVKTELNRREQKSEYEADMQNRGYEKHFTGEMKESTWYGVLNGCPIEHKSLSPVYQWKKKQNAGEDLIEAYNPSGYKRSMP